VKRLISILAASLISLALTFVAHPLQSDNQPQNCEVSPECIGRLPYYEPLVLINPVKGGKATWILSVWGDSRDEGKRKHEGMDIFAPKGTPVVAPISGIVTRVGRNSLGGNVVWLSSRRTQHSFYFAHLAQVKVCKGDTVALGSVLGTVGNTGNAKLTAPHLHFGIYMLNTRKAMRREIVWKDIPANEVDGDARYALAW
jgi:murein DD-endopeptidase MepM/ murein hydrolase activator NlpD